MLNEKQITAQLRLFKSYTLGLNESYAGVLHEQAYGKGVLFLEEPPMSVLEKAIDMYGKDGEKWNQTFHKSFATVRDLPIETLIAQQIIHYFTTYGLESLGLYDQDLVYIPHENLDIPELDQDITLTVIHKITEEQLKEKLMVLLTSGIALSGQTIADIMELSDFIDLDMVDDVKNKEVRIALYDKYHIVPGNNTEFLRYLINKVTGRTLLIKDKSTIEALKKASTHDIWSELNGYVKLEGYYINGRFRKTLPKNVSISNDIKLTNGYEVLAKIFLRYKDLFLAMKRKVDNEDAKKINYIINKISYLSKKHHEPLEPFILDRLTSLSSLKELHIKANEIEAALNECPIFRVIRILNSITYRLECTEDNDNIVYTIRNGKGFADTIYNAPLKGDKRQAQLALKDFVKAILIKRLSKSLKDKTIFLPDYISYTIPQSEKKFNGNIPEGSYIEVNRNNDMVVGIHWTNLNDNGWGGRVDLDLHAQNKTEQYGWNNSYRSTNGSDFYFSGDLTDAPKPNGATEVYYVGKNCGNKVLLLSVNNYTANNANVPFEFLIAKTEQRLIDRDYVIDPNNIIVQIPMNFEHDNGSVRQMTLGLLTIDLEKIRYYLNDFALGSSIVTKYNKTAEIVQNYLDSYMDTQLRLKPILEEAGVIFTDVPFKEELVPVEVTNAEGIKETLYKKVRTNVDYNLSLESITKETLIKMLTEA